MTDTKQSRGVLPLTQFRTLGRSGLVVSPLALGAMTFGQERWGADAKIARAIFNAYRAAGGNFIDTADVYSGGRSEELLGQFIEESNARDEIVLATKFGFNHSTSPLAEPRSEEAIQMQAVRERRTFIGRWMLR